LRKTRGGSWPSFASGSRGSAWGRAPDKTRLIEFGRHAARDRRRRGLGKPETMRLPGVHAHLREVPEREVLD
jgi:hypothetical protein